MIHLRDEFLSEEDLDLRNLNRGELYAYWNCWLLQAQATNGKDRRSYSHGVFVLIESPEAEESQGDMLAEGCEPQERATGPRPRDQ